MDELALQVKFHIVVDKIQSCEENLFALKESEVMYYVFPVAFFRFCSILTILIKINEKSYTVPPISDA